MSRAPHYINDKNGMRRFRTSDQPCLIECAYNRGGCVKRHYAGIVPRNFAKHGCPGYSRSLPDDKIDPVRLNDIKLKQKRPILADDQSSIGVID